jgi:hypothetical protein
MRDAMIDDARWPSHCAYCGEGVDAGEPLFSIPDLLIEMHEACYRLHLEKHPKCPDICQIG